MLRHVLIEEFDVNDSHELIINSGKSSDRVDNVPTLAGLEIGSVSVKWFGRFKDHSPFSEVLRHEGKPSAKVLEILTSYSVNDTTKIVITGNSAKDLLNLPYKSESECFEKSLDHLGIDADILLSLGGESFSLFTLKNKKIKNIISSTKCAAGTGEFIVQQFQRMGMNLQEGIAAGKNGKKVNLASRCSVHCKSDATHKLNKGECSTDDIACSLIYDLSEKVSKMVASSGWPSKKIMIVGGLSLNHLFVETLKEKFPDSLLIVPEQGPCLEAFGASLFAADLNGGNKTSITELFHPVLSGFRTLNPLSHAEHLVDYRVPDKTIAPVVTNDPYILGVDAGSTTTKAILFNMTTRSVDASCYLRTHGNPVQATKNCINDILEKTGGIKITLKNVAVTGSGREMVSVYLDNCLSYNEILAHARAAAEEVPDVDTVFEIGGQDSKFISFQGGIPVDYAMNEGCSAGTGSFLEESLSVDLGVPVEKISDRAVQGMAPISFGERCAAFINTDLRNALQHGAKQEDVIAGLVYSIADNYISRIVGVKSTGRRIIFQGGVALNRAVALAIACRAGQKVVVPPYPELMGCVGCALITMDDMSEGLEKEKNCDLDALVQGIIEVKNQFTCKSCKNNCEIKNISVNEKTYPYGGLCSKYELTRKNADSTSGMNLVELRNKMLFEDFGPVAVKNSRGTIGLPMALSSYEFFPFYTKLINEFGFDVVLSEPSKQGNGMTSSATCYPCEIAHGAAFDLLSKNVDYIFFPRFIEAEVNAGYTNAYSCPSVALIPDVVSSAFDGITKKMLSPHISLSKRLIKMTWNEIEKTGAILGIKRTDALRAGSHALEHYKQFKKTILAKGESELLKFKNDPVIVIAGRSYITCSSQANLKMDRKIASRGYHVIPQDMLPLISGPKHPENMWYAAQQMTNAAWYTKAHPNMHLCMISCFSCAPDASAYHVLRHELQGDTFCYLEIDSHTAHAGFDTRIGAFLDIVEAKKRKENKRKNTAEVQ